MQLTRLRLAEIRNYAALEFAPAPGLNVLLGPNAQGKSNLLEAIGLLGTGKSFRTSREREILRHGEPLGTVDGEARVDAGLLRLACRFDGSSGSVRKTYAINGQPVKYARYLGHVRVVTFAPAHLALVGGAPALRRAFLNAALAQDSPAYFAALAAYSRTLAQKSALLRSAGVPDRALLDIYNQSLADSGARLMSARAAFAAALDARARATYDAWNGAADGAFEIRYRPNIAVAPGLDPLDLAGAVRARLEEVAGLEAARRTALAGPHRDDLELVLGERPLSAYGSQGQQRTGLLALKVAEYHVLRERSGEAPLLLLDDVLSELDERRQRAFIAGVGGFEQAFVTTTHPIDLPVAATFAVHDATVERAA